MKKNPSTPTAAVDYSGLLGSVTQLLETARRASARTVNAFMTATYWEIGRRIVEFEQHGAKRAAYGEHLLKRLAEDLTLRHGRSFSVRNLENMRLFYGVCGVEQISQTLSEKLERSTGPVPTPQKPQTPAEKSRRAAAESPASSFNMADIARAFPLPWSHYVLLVRGTRSPEALRFYHTEALRGGWTVRQLQRQMDSQFYERTALSRNKAAMLAKGALLFLFRRSRNKPASLPRSSVG